MVNQSKAMRDEAVLDDVFAALASPVRRSTLARLGDGARSASELALPHDMTLSGFMKHLRILEQAGLVACRKDGRTVTCTLVPASMSKASQWIAARQARLTDRLDALGRHLHHRAEIDADR